MEKESKASPSSISSGSSNYHDGGQLGGEIACPYCRTTSKHLVSSRDINRHTAQCIFDYYKCAKCGLVFLYPTPADMTPSYKGGYQAIPRDLAELREIAREERYRLELILEYKSRGRLLEIGPWMGIFSCNAKDAGFDVTAIEMDQQCVDFLRDEVGIKAIQSEDPVTAISTLEQDFDVIVLWHSLEHLPNPWHVLQKAAERLTIGGILVVAVPNIESNDFSALGEEWFHLDAPRHLHFFPMGWLEGVCTASGLNPLKLATNDRLSELLSRDAWYKKASSVVSVPYLRGLVSRILYRWIKYRAKGHYSGSGLTAVFTRTDVATGGQKVF